MKTIGSIAILCSTMALVWAAQAEEREAPALCHELQKTKRSLAEGIRESSKGAEVPISAKFELDDHGKLSLSVYTVGKGLGVAAENNVLKELSATPESPQWVPSVEIFKDPVHIARASEQLTLMALTSKSLVEIVNKAEAEKLGTVYAIAPILQEKKPFFDVLVVLKGKVTEIRYDLYTGAKL